MLIWLVIKKLHAIVTELFTKDKKLNITAVFNVRLYLPVPKDVILNTTHFAISHSSDIDSKHFKKFQRKLTWEPSIIFATDTTLPSNNALIFEIIYWKKHKEQSWGLAKKIRDKKLQYDINRAAVKISALSSETIDKYGCLTSEEILPKQQY